MSQVCQLMQVYQFHPVVSLISLFLQFHLLFSNLFILHLILKNGTIKSAFCIERYLFLLLFCGAVL